TTYGDCRRKKLRFPRLALLSSLFRLGRRVFRLSPGPPLVDGNAREEAGRLLVAAGTHRGSKRLGPGRRALGSAAGSLRCAGSGLSRSYPRLSSLDVSAPKKLLAILSLGLQLAADRPQKVIHAGR